MKLDLVGNVRKIVSSRLSWVVASAVFGTILLIELIIFIPSYMSHRQELLQQVEARGLAYVRAVSELRGEMTPEAFTKEVTRASAGSDWVGAATLTPHGEILGQSGIPLEFIRPGVLISETQRMTHNNISGFEICWPPGKTGQSFAVAARVDTAHVSQRLWDYTINITALSLIIAFGTTLVIMWLVGWRILLPVLSLREGMMQVAGAPMKAGQVPLPKAPARDEIGDLVNASQRMFRHVAATLDDVMKRNHDLAVSERRFRRIFEESFDAIFVDDGLDAATIRDLRERGVALEVVPAESAPATAAAQPVDAMLQTTGGRP